MSNEQNNQMDKKEMIKFKGKFNRQFFPKNNKKYNDGEFAILTFTVEEELEGSINVHPKFKTISVKGVFPYYISDLSETHVIMCEVVEDAKWGKQNQLLMIYRDVDFSSIEAQKTFLQLAGVTEKQIRDLYLEFDNPIDIIANGNVEELCKVKGIGESTAKKMIEKYVNNVDYSEAYITLSGYGMTPHMIRKLSDLYGSPTALINKINKNPYILTEVEGIGFEKADKMALASGMNRFSPLRLRAFIKHILNEGAMNGYSWISSNVLVSKIEEELDEFPLEDIVEAVIYLKEKRVLWDGEQGKVALQRYYDLERKIRDELVRIRDGANKFSFEGWEERVKQAEKLQGWEYEAEQKQGIEMVLNEQVAVITGGAGTGKTATALGAIKALGDISFGQCCLSGKGASRMTEATGYEAYTIHRLLGYSPSFDEEGEGSLFLHNKKNPLDLDVILLDEFAMIGGHLFLDLLKAISSRSKLILLGDEGQLSSIGALNIGSDLTHSPQISTTTLTKIHRQAQKSAVITESIKIRQSEQIIDKNFIGKEVRGELRDLELDIYNDKSLTVPKVIEHFKEKLKNSGNDIMEVQVIVPMTMRGESSVYNLNNLIQPLYNPPSDNKKEVFLPLAKDKGYTLRTGDKVINTKNNYKMTVVEQDDFLGEGWCKIPINEEEFLHIPIFNGFVGEVIDICNDELIIYFPLVEKTVSVNTEHWKKEKGIHLAYALTVHKTQGSSYKYPICAIDYSHYMMLSRELVYTAITRSSEHCTLIAENKALRYATKTTSVENKQTFLKELLEEEDINTKCI